MNLNKIRENLGTMSPDERESAIALLEALGIKGADKPLPRRKSGTTKLSPYYEHVEISCLCCASKRQRHFVYRAAQFDGQWYLQATKIGEVQMGMDEELPMKERKAEVLTCPLCLERLAERDPRELARAIILLIHKGGERNA